MDFCPVENGNLLDDDSIFINTNFLQPLDSFRCPITKAVMKDPVIITSSGYTYERAAITHYAQQCLSKNQEPHDPITRAPFDLNTQIIPNRSQKSVIDEWIKSATSISPMSLHSVSDTASIESVCSTELEEQAKLETEAVDIAIGSVQVDQMVDLLQHASISNMIRIAKAIKDLTKSTEGNDNTPMKAKMVKEGAIPPLINMLNLNNETATVVASAALWSLSVLSESKKRMVLNGEIDALVEVIKGTYGGQEAYFNVAGIIRNLARTDANKLIIARAGAIPPLIRLLRTGNNDVKRKAAAAIGLLAVNLRNKILVAEEGGIQLFTDLLREESCGKAKAEIAAALATLATVEANKSAIVDTGAVPLLIRMVEHGCDKKFEEQALQAAGALSILAIDHPENSKVIGMEGAIPALVRLLHSNNGNVQLEALSALGNLSFDSTNQLAIIEAGAVKPFQDLLKNGTEEERGVVAAILYNLSAYPVNHHALMEPGLKLVLKNLCRGKNSSSSRDVRSDCCKVLERLKEAKQHMQRESTTHSGSMLSTVFGLIGLSSSKAKP